MSIYSYNQIKEFLNKNSFKFIEERTSDGVVYLKMNHVKIYKDTLSIFVNDIFKCRFFDDFDYLKKLLTHDI